MKGISLSYSRKLTMKKDSVVKIFQISEVMLILFQQKTRRE